MQVNPFDPRHTLHNYCWFFHGYLWSVCMSLYPFEVYVCPCTRLTGCASRLYCICLDSHNCTYMRIRTFTFSCRIQVRTRIFQIAQAMWRDCKLHAWANKNFFPHKHQCTHLRKFSHVDGSINIQIRIVLHGTGCTTRLQAAFLLAQLRVCQIFGAAKGGRAPFHHLRYIICILIYVHIYMYIGIWVYVYLWGGISCRTPLRRH